MTTFKDALAPLAASMRPVRTEREVLRVFGNLETVSDAGTSLDLVRNQVLRWVNKRCGPLPDEAWKYQPFEKISGGVNAHCVSIRQAATDFWALRADDVDKSVLGRVWSTEITVGKASEQAAAFSCRLLVSATQDNFTFTPAVPGVVRQIADEFILRNGGVLLRAEEILVDDPAVLDGLISRIEDPQRLLPIVVFSIPDGSADALVDVKALSTKLVGLTQFATVTSECAWQLTEALGKQRSIFGGGFKTYQPGFSTTETPYRHPLVVPQHLQTDEQRGRAVENLSIALARQRTLGSRLGKDVLTFSNVRRLISRSRSEIDQAESNKVETQPQDIAASGNEAEMQRLKTENRDLWDELETAEQQHSKEVEDLIEEQSKAEKRAEEAEFNLIAAKSRIDQLTQVLESRGQGVEVDIATPEDWSEFAEWVDRNFAGKVALTPRARKKIKKALFTDIDCACRSIVWLAENTSAANNEVVESGVTNARCGGDAYPVTWQGQSYEVEWHIKNGNSRASERCLRIYYFWDGDQVVVTHMPSHRKTSMS